MKAREKEYLEDFRQKARLVWPENRALTMVCHGHSVPAGYFKTPDVQTRNAYPRLLHDALCNTYPHAVINMIVTAIGGENSVSGAKRFTQDVLNHNPDVVTIDYALNDRRIGLDSARQAWREMISQSLQSGVKVILLTPTPDQTSRLEDADDPLNLHATQVRLLADEYGIGLSDSLVAFRCATAQGTTLESLMSQVNHPNAAGHKLVAAELVKWF